MVIVLARGVLARGARNGTVTALGLVFAAFYVPLALIVHFWGSPPGLHVNASQNAFHFIVGPSALVLAGWAWLAQRHRVAPRRHLRSDRPCRAKFSAGRHPTRPAGATRVAAAVTSGRAAPAAPGAAVTRTADRVSGGAPRLGQVPLCRAWR
jgi:hypothetical protein